MSKIRRVDFSPDEWLSGTSDLEVSEKGAYWTVCALIYSRGGPIPDDAKWIARNCGCSVRMWLKLRERLLELGKLRLVDGYLTNSRAETEILKAENRVRMAREAAEKSAKTRRNPRENEPETGKINGLAQADASTFGEANHQPSTKNQQEDSHSQGRARPIPPGWQPSEELLAWVKTARPDIQAARLALELEGFKAHAKANNRTSHDWDQSARGWILKTKITTNPEPSPHGAQRTHRSAGAENFETRTIAATAFSRARGQRPATDSDGVGGVEAERVATPDDDAG